MKKLLLTTLLCAVAALTHAQTTDFDRAFDACIKASDGLAGGFANAEQLSAAANTLKSLKIGNLPLKYTEGDKPSLNGHLVFTADFISERIKSQEIYKMADEYAKRSGKRGTGSSQVLMTTILIPAGKTYTYEIAGCTDEVTVGCVAETNGLMSWKLTTTEYKSKTSQTYRDNKDEKKGRPSRRMTLKSSEKYKIKVEITNTSKHDSSFAVVAK